MNLKGDKTLINLDSIIMIAQQNIDLGVFLLSFTDAFISPIVPDIVIIPASIADPSNALWLAALATIASVLGAFIGYFIGHKFSGFAQRRIIPPKHMQHIRTLVERYGGWAVFWAAMAPIPYKFVAISAGVLKINLKLFTIATILGRGKRFLIIGLAVHYLGPQVIPLIHEYSRQVAFILALVILILLAYAYFRYRNKKALTKT